MYYCVASNENGYSQPSGNINITVVPRPGMSSKLATTLVNVYLMRG